MSVHMFQYYVGRGDMAISDLESAINDWINSNAEWVGDETSHAVVEYQPPDGSGGSVYHGGVVRFEKSDTKDNLLQKVTDKLKDKVAWYRVAYHECDHDESGRLGCQWQDKTEWTDSGVAIPSYVPDHKVAA